MLFLAICPMAFAQILPNGEYYIQCKTGNIFCGLNNSTQSGANLSVAGNINGYNSADKFIFTHLVTSK